MERPQAPSFYKQEPVLICQWILTHRRCGDGAFNSQLYESYESL